MDSRVIDGVEVVELDDWRKFLDLASGELTAPGLIFRGQAMDWPVQSSLQRLQTRYPKRKNVTGMGQEEFDEPPLTAERQLQAFRRALGRVSPPNSATTSDVEEWALGQHHGLATPLTDWSQSPAKALYFAFESETVISNGQLVVPEHRAVYVLAWERFKDLLYRPKNNPRAHAQEGLLLNQGADGELTGLREIFTQRYPSEEIQQLQELGISLPFRKYLVAANDRNGCLIALNKLGINRLSLFPDPDGAAAYINSLWQPGHEDPMIFL